LHGVVLVAEFGGVYDDFVMVFVTLINENDQPYRANRVLATDAAGVAHSVGPLQFQSRSDAGCLGRGVVAPSGRCNAVLQLRDPARFAGSSISLTVSEASGARSVTVDGLAW
jgi:hypothetical protein